MTHYDLRTFRKRLNISQRQFANYLGYSGKAGGQVLMSQIESGMKPITPRLARAIQLWMENKKLKEEIRALDMALIEVATNTVAIRRVKRRTIENT